MAIRIARNDAGNCINFFGTSNPTYWNACLEGEINEENPNNVNVINSVRTIEEGTTVYEFFNLPYTLFVDKDENAFESASECAEYITDNANVLSDTGTFVFSQNDLLDAQREATDTTVLFSNGDIYAVNSLQAVAQNDGTITVRTVRGNKDIYQRLRYYNVSVNNSAITNFNTINAAVDRLNEVLSGGTITSDTGSAASGESTESASATFTVYGDRITDTGSGARLGYTSTADPGNFDTSNGFYSNQTINESGEYFEFTQEGGDWSNTTGLTFGLFDETTYDVADLDEDVAGNAVKSILRLRLKNTPFVFKDPASTYGRLNESGFSSTVNTVAQWRVGLDSERRPYIAAYIGNSWTTVCRTETATPADTEFRFVCIMPLANTLEGIRNMTVNTLVEAPTLTWHYIESPDGDFDYPLFATAEEANYVDEQYGTAADGAGASHTHTYVDETPTSRLWYMPQTYAFHDQNAAPTPPSGVVYNEIATGADADYAPSSYGTQTLTVNEGVNVNYQLRPAGDTATYSISGAPAGLAYNATTGNLTGTAPEVTGDNVANPSDDYTITVTKTNEYGSSTGTLTLTVNNLDAPVTAISGFTHISGTTAMVDSDTIGDGGAVELDDVLGDTRRLIIHHDWVRVNVLPNLSASNDTIYIGILKSTGDLTDGITDADFDAAFKFVYSSSNVVAVSSISNGYASLMANQSWNSTDGTNFNYYLDHKDARVWMLAMQAGQGGNTQPTPTNGGTWTYSQDRGTGSFADKTVVIAAVNTTADISTTDLSEIDSPQSLPNLSLHTKALDFSGGSERAQQASNSNAVTPMNMGGLATTHGAPLTTGYTSAGSNSRPWMTTIVFKHDGNSSNQHIWNMGEGASSGNDNIYLRISSTGQLYFGWGREGTGYNECSLGFASSSHWYAVGIAHTGERLSGTNATAANLADCFKIYVSGTNTSWAMSSDKSTATNWTTGGTGIRMDRGFTGTLTIGGRGANRNYHGKVSSFMTTTLRVNVPMPDSTEMAMAMTDPVRWVDTYKIGQQFRRPNYSSNVNNFQRNVYYPSYSTQVWLMGDGPADSYVNMIRSNIYQNEQNFSKLNMLSMVANDIETVTITGLS